MLDTARSEQFHTDLHRLDDTRRFLECASASSGSPESLTREVLARHGDVQRGKFDRGRSKMPWLEVTAGRISLTMTRVGGLTKEATVPSDIAAHPYRLSSADALDCRRGGTMKKSQPTSDDCKLMDRLTPDPSLGRLLGILTTTYEMQPEFFETDFLPTLLGLGAWDDRSWTSRIALEKHLADLEAADNAGGCWSIPQTPALVACRSCAGAVGSRQTPSRQGSDRRV